MMNNGYFGKPECPFLISKCANEKTPTKVGASRANRRQLIPCLSFAHFHIFLFSHLLLAATAYSLIHGSFKLYIYIFLLFAY